MEEKSDFYSIAAQSKVKIFNLRIPNSQSISAEVDGQSYIGLDNSKSATIGEEQAHLGHELGHCLYGGFYTRSAPYDVVERHEWKADKWYILHAIPKERLLAKLREGYDAWEIAEQLDTTEDYIRMAYYYYKDNA